MKLKQNIVITDAAQFLKGNYHSCFSLYDSTEYLPDKWMVVGEVDIDIEADTGKLIQYVKAEIDEKIGKATAALNVLEQRRAELLAITYQDES